MSEAVKIPMFYRNQVFFFSRQRLFNPKFHENEAKYDKYKRGLTVTFEIINS